jgi:hypothetical protein
VGELDVISVNTPPTSLNASARLHEEQSHAFGPLRPKFLRGSRPPLHFRKSLLDDFSGRLGKTILCGICSGVDGLIPCITTQIFRKRGDRGISFPPYVELNITLIMLSSQLCDVRRWRPYEHWDGGFGDNIS